MRTNSLGLFLSVALFVLIASCTPDVPETPVPDVDPSDTTAVNPVETYLITDTTDLASLWHSRYAATGFESVKDIKQARWIVDGTPRAEYRKALRTSTSDLRYEFYSEDYMRFVSEADGYAVTLPLSLDLVPDYYLPKYAQRFVSEEVDLRVTMEHVQPYTPNEYYYGIYTGEWLDRYISNSKYLASNGMKYYATTITNDESLIEGYSTTVYSILADGLEKPLYKIALVRPLGQWSKFVLIVYKCKTSRLANKFEDILKSVRVISNFGRSKNYFPAQEAKANPHWNAETLAYYNKLLSQSSFDFGVFSDSMVAKDDDTYDYKFSRIKATKDRLEEAFGHGYEIMPTYAHLAWGTTPMYFPLDMAREFAGGNGFDGKPVLQYTYQFTINNNNLSAENTTNNVTPTFDILRGKYDKVLTRLAQDIKSYGKPVIFRLNNEMNSDWTSYSGIINLIDPTIFIDTWRYLYDLFEKEGVDNCIWQFNPVAQSCPYSNWGEMLSYYPGNEYVQMIGLTNYEMGNYLPLTSFRERYSSLYAVYSQYFVQMPWIIGEFACGSGGATTGEEMRNASEQAAWVRGMFNDLNNRAQYPYVQPIKAGIWFSANDYSGDVTMNLLELRPELTETLQAFRDGFAEMYK